MVIRDIQQILEKWAPPALAWERDNVGLQIGSPERKVRRIVVALDTTDGVIDEAQKQRADLVISHHPLLFHPPRALRETDRIGRMVQRLIQNKIAVYAAHTNLDFTSGGVSFALAERLGIEHPSILSGNHRVEKKVVTFVPRDHADSVRSAMAEAGAGEIGYYTSCSFQVEGSGSFRAGAGAHPAVGRSGVLEQIDEVRLEMIVPEWKLAGVLDALRQSHPYEEVAYDVYSLDNISRKFGAGAIGALAKPVTLRDLLRHVSSALGVPQLRYCGRLQSRIATVAVCGGSGAEFIDAALRGRADAFITADVRYHNFQEPDGRMALIDAGHFETEHPVVQKIVSMLKNSPLVRKENVRISASRAAKNPVQYFSS